jgi:hypothetical protein
VIDPRKGTLILVPAELESTLEIPSGTILSPLKSRPSLRIHHLLRLAAVRHHRITLTHQFVSVNNHRILFVDLVIAEAFFLALITDRDKVDSLNDVLAGRSKANGQWAEITEFVVNMPRTSTHNNHLTPDIVLLKASDDFRSRPLAHQTPPHPQEATSIHGHKVRVGGLYAWIDDYKLLVGNKIIRDDNLHAIRTDKWKFIALLKECDRLRKIYIRGKKPEVGG